MAGGIQPGMVATDEAARTLDKHCKDQSKLLQERLIPKYNGRLTAQAKLAQSQIPTGRGACQPDGLLWFWDGQLIAVFEAKKQQDAGNAIERWFKNHYICREINPTVSYVTFAVGEGAYLEGQIGKALSVAHKGGFDTYVPEGNSCFMNKAGFTQEEILAYMLSVLEERVGSLS